MALKVSSVQNSRVKQVIALQKPRERRRSGLFAVEGQREVSLAIRAGYELEALFICEQLFVPDSVYPIPMDEMKIILVSQEVYAKMAYRESTGGVLALAVMRSLGLEQLEESRRRLAAQGGLKAPIYLILEHVEKPGNIGAMLRTADAAGLSGVIVCDPATDFYNPNVVRSSVGTLFTVPVAAASAALTAQWLSDHGIRTFATSLEASRPYFEHDYTEPCAFLLGSEARGLSDFWLKAADERIIVPMHGSIDSMNVSNTAAIVIFEALRQRAVRTIK